MATLEEEELEVSSLVLELDLISILEHLVNGTSWTKHCKDLTPVRSFDTI